MTSPPYWALRDYGIDGQLGLEETFQNYISKLCDIFDEVKRVLRKDGTCWVNIGDTYWGGGNNRGSTEENLSEKQFSNRGARGQIQMDWKKTRDDCKQLDIKFNTRKRFCCNCGKKFDAMPGQYFCDGACAGVDNTRREVKGEMQDKTLCNIPARFSIEMQNRGWILRNTIIWHKPNCMPSSVKDRFTVDFEYLFFFVKSKRYWFERQFEKSVTGKSEPFNYRVCDVKRGYIKSGQYKASQEEIDQYHGKNIIYFDKRTKRAVWSITTKPFPEAHFATYPEELCETPIKAGCPVGGLVLDPFFGAGTTGLVALKQGKQFIGIELNPKYIEIANNRLKPYLEQQTLPTIPLKRPEMPQDNKFEVKA